MSEYEKGYQQALEDINKPMKPIIEKWQPSECPRCKKDYRDYEPCDDGYYERATSLERCPYCGQKLKWFDYD
jgi:rubrerythrin